MPASPRPHRNLRVRAIYRDPPNVKQLARALIAVAEDMALKEQEKQLAKMLSIIKQNPGIRPLELNRKVGRKYSRHYRNVLVSRGSIRKEDRGSVVRYYPTVH